MRTYSYWRELGCLYDAKNKLYHKPEEAVSHRVAKSKIFIPKVMFLCAVDRPRFDKHHKRELDRKISIWLFKESFPERRISRNRPACTLKMKSLNFSKDI